VLPVFQCESCFGRVANIPDEQTFVVRLIRIVSPFGGRFLQRREHQVIVQLHLNRPGVIRARNKLRDFRIRSIGYVHDGPAVIPEMPEI
jgi:hypothetical protein